MAPASTQGTLPAGDHKYLADRYRRAAFDLLRAAKALRDTTAELATTRVRVAHVSIVDIADALAILHEMPPARTTPKVDKT